MSWGILGRLDMDLVLALEGGLTSRVMTSSWQQDGRLVLSCMGSAAMKRGLVVLEAVLAGTVLSQGGTIASLEQRSIPHRGQLVSLAGEKNFASH